MMAAKDIEAIEIAKKLIFGKSNIDFYNYLGLTALSVCIYQNNKKLAVLLLEENA